MTSTTTLPIAISLEAGPIDAKLDQILAGQARQENALATIAEALQSLKTEDDQLKAEVDQVVVFVGAQAASLASLQSTLADITANGSATEAQLADLAQIGTDLQAQHDKLATVLPAHTE